MTGEMNNGQKLVDVWQTRILPDMDEVADSTLEEYEGSLRLWARLSGDPDVTAINRECVRTFRKKLITTPYRRGKQKKTGLRSGATVNRIMRDLHKIISPLWPADRVNSGGMGLIPFFKWPKAVSVQKKLPFVFSLTDLDKLYLNTGACRQPSRFSSRSTPMNEPRLWRVALALALNSAPRTWDLFNLPKAAVSLDSSDQFEFGYVGFTARKTGKLHKIPLNECAARHIEDLLRRPVLGCGASDRLFPGFYKGQPFYSTWKRITAAAGLSGAFESMRKTSVTRHNNVIWNVGFWLSGHLSPGVFGSYDNPSDRIFEAVYALEQPTQFVEGMKSFSSQVA